MNDAPKKYLKYPMSLLLLALSVCASVPVMAQGMHLPIVGRQFPTVGFSLAPGFIYDGAAEGTEVGLIAPTGGGTVRLGLQHVVSRSLSMNGELEGGLHYFTPHTASPFETAPSQLAFAWQVTMLARWFPIGEQAGWTGAVGGHYFRARLGDAPLLSLGADLRLGRFIWTSDERFIIIEAGYGAPLLQGLSISTAVADQVGEVRERTWALHRFSLGLTMAF